MRKDKQVSLMDLAVSEAKRRRFLKMVPFDKEQTAFESQDLDRKHTLTISRSKNNIGVNSTGKEVEDEM